MCSSADDPTTYDSPKRPACEYRIWMHGRERPCGMEFGVTSWTDAYGKQHTACRHHKAEVQYRHKPAA